MEKAPISVVVINYNEAHHLESCLSSVQFCDELIFIDLESTDNSLSIAHKFSNKLYTHKRLDIVEPVRKWSIDKTSNNWVLFIDPDETIQKKLQTNICSKLKMIKKNTSVIELPWQFYFKNNPLNYGHWGGNKYKSILVNKKLVDFNSSIHNSFTARKKTHSVKIIRKKSNYIKHNWSNSFNDLYKKHNRYLKEEYKSLSEKGITYSVINQGYYTLKAFVSSMFIRLAFMDGKDGVLLSCFWTWYTFKKWQYLYSYEKKLDRKKDYSNNGKT